MKSSLILQVFDGETLPKRKPCIQLGGVFDHSAKGPYMDNHLLDHLLGALKNTIPSHPMDHCWKFLPLDHKASNISWARRVYAGTGSWFITWRNAIYHGPHCQKEEHHDTGRNILMKNYYWWRKYDEEKQIDRGSSWAPHLPLMSKGERMLEGQEYNHQWQKGRLLIKVATIDITSPTW